MRQGYCNPDVISLPLLHSWKPELGRCIAVEKEVYLGSLGSEIGDFGFDNYFTLPIHNDPLKGEQNQAAVEADMGM